MFNGYKHACSVSPLANLHVGLHEHEHEHEHACSVSPQADLHVHYNVQWTCMSWLCFLVYRLAITLNIYFCTSCFKEINELFSNRSVKCAYIKITPFTVLLRSRARSRATNRATNRATRPRCQYGICVLVLVLLGQRIHT